MLRPCVSTAWLALTLAVACGRTTPPSVAPPSPAITVEDVADSRAPATDWREDPRVLALLEGHYDEDYDEDERIPPDEYSVEELVHEQRIEVYAVGASWTEPESDRLQPRARAGQVFLVVVTPSGTHVALLARQHHYGTEPELDEQPALPVVSDVAWRGIGVVGPELLLRVASRSLWGTQCDEGYDRRTEGVICDLEGGAMHCALVPLALDYFDGCGGAEAYEFDGVEPPCSRIAFEATWHPEHGRLRVTLDDDTPDLECFSEPDSRSGSLDDQWLPPRSISYPELFAAPYAVEVTTVPRAAVSRHRPVET